MLLGASKTYKDGKVEAGFAFVLKEEIEKSPFLYSTGKAVDMFRSWVSSKGD
jgi:hypothetical protein